MLCLIKYDLDINVYNFENCLFSTVVSLQKWLTHFCTTGRHIGIIKTELFSCWKNENIFRIIDQIEAKRIEYMLEWNLKNLLVWIFSVPFSLKGSSKCTNHVNVHKPYAVEYINTVFSLDYPFQFRNFLSC